VGFEETFHFDLFDFSIFGDSLEYGLVREAESGTPPDGIIKKSAFTAFQTLNRKVAPFETIERVGLSQYKAVKSDGSEVFVVWADGRPLDDQIATKRVRVTGIDGEERTMDLERFEADDAPVLVEPVE